MFIKTPLLFSLLLSLFVVVNAEDSNVRDYCNDAEWSGFNCTKCREIWKPTTEDIKNGEYTEFRDAIQPYLRASNVLYDYR